MALLASFPDAHFIIDQLFWMGDEEHGYKTSMRWSMLGTNEATGCTAIPLASVVASGASRSIRSVVENSLRNLCCGMTSPSENGFTWRETAC